MVSLFNDLIPAHVLLSLPCELPSVMVDKGRTIMGVELTFMWREWMVDVSVVNILTEGNLGVLLSVTDASN